MHTAPYRTVQTALSLALGKETGNTSLSRVYVIYWLKQ